LQRNDLFPIEIAEVSEKKNLNDWVVKITSFVSQKDLLIFYRQLSALVGAKIPIVPALKTIYSQTESGYLRTVIDTIQKVVGDGMQLSDAFDKHPKVFATLDVAMIRAGELSGKLQDSIIFVAENNENNYQLKSKITGAMIYPAFVMLVAGVIGFATITFILPRLTEVIKEMDVAVPWYTTMMMNLGDFMSAYWWAVLIVLAGIAVSIVYYTRSESGQKEWDQLKLKVPAIGVMFQYVYITRFAQNLSALMVAGIPIVKALMVVADVVENATYKNIILAAAQDVKVGGTINQEFYSHKEIPPMVSSMIKIGEETGRLSDILNDVAKFYNAEVEQMTRNISSIIEPVLIVFLGVGVGVLVVSVLLPIYNIAGQM
jgi:type IV pilus assembly protein PilC